MLQDNELKEKTFEEMYNKALLQIPLLTKEWTNFNPSDPGITVLENITAFHVLQQSYINQISDEVRLMLLKLVGVKAKTVKSAQILLSVQNNGTKVSFPANQKFHVGTLCFENDKPFEIGEERISAIFYKSGNKLTDISGILDSSIPYMADVFGKNPKAGDELYFIINSFSSNQEELLLYVNLWEGRKRNPEEWNGNNPFAAISWQILTEKGYVDLKVADYTECFLQSGLVRLQLPKKTLGLYEHFGYHGYAVRAVLTKAEYDNAPRVKGIQGFLFEAWQKESRALCYTYESAEVIELHSDMLEQGFVMVYCKEEGSPHYFRYEDSNGENRIGRYYEKEILGKNFWRFSFSKERFGYMPRGEKNSIKVVLYDETTMRRYYLDKVYGYDEQEIELPFQNIISESFSVAAMRITEDGQKIYDFFEENEQAEGALQYSVDAGKGLLYIHKVGDYVNAELFLCNLAVTMGAYGNISAGRSLIPRGYSDIIVTNVCDGTGGRDEEPAAELMKEYQRKAMDSEVAVTSKDYETIVKATPGLCIGKVKAILGRDANHVIIVATPAVEDRFAKLSDIYKERMRQHINHYRMLSTRITIQDAVYVPLDVVIICKIKSGYPQYEKIIREALEKEIDFDKSNRAFGEILQYDDVQRTVSNLECIESVDNIWLRLKENRYSRKQDVKIIIPPECLLYLDEMEIKAEFI